MKLNSLPITLTQANVCPACNEHDILNWKKHFLDNHKDLVAYHYLVKTGELIKRLKL